MLYSIKVVLLLILKIKVASECKLVKNCEISGGQCLISVILYATINLLCL